MESSSEHVIVGWVQYEPLETGIWYVQDALGANWTPTRFPEDIQKVNLKVSLRAAETSAVSFSMFGTPIQVLDYKIIE